MEPDTIHSIANALFEAMTISSWKDKSADEIELEVQKTVSQLANVLLQNFLLPSRIKDIHQSVENGLIRCQTCDCKLQLHKQNQALHPKTIFGNKIAVKRNQYYCSNCDNYQMVADRQLGLPAHQMTARLSLVTALCGASWPYEVAEAFLDFLFGVEVSAKTVEHVTRDEKMLPVPLEADPLDSPPGVVCADGVLVRGRKTDEWLEMKVCSMFSNVVEVSRNRKEVLDASFVASACQQWKDFIEPVTGESQRRGLVGTEAVEFISDGAEGIWSLQQMVFPCARLRLDLYHARSKISERTNQAYWKNPARKKHQDQLQQALGKGKVDEAVAYIQKHMPKLEYKRNAATKLIGYLKRNKERIPNYDRVKAGGGTVSSGLVEKANDLIVARRMKAGIMHWTREGADPVLQHRTAFINKHARTRTGPYELAFCQA
jgi:hypothetical protein